MKLRIQGNSLRLRVSPSEMTRLLEAGRIEETIHFAHGGDARLTYALEHAAADRDIGRTEDHATGDGAAGGEHFAGAVFGFDPGDCGQRGSIAQWRRTA